MNTEADTDGISIAASTNLEKMEALTVCSAGVSADGATDEDADADSDANDDIEGLELELEPDNVVFSILLSVHVRNWIKKNINNHTLIKLFKIRMKSLAEGTRNYCNFKELKSKQLTQRIYESKLDRGIRILFTKWANIDPHTSEVVDCLVFW
jgi:hypothetical protein